MTSQCGGWGMVCGSRETWPSMIWVQNGHFWIDVIMQWSLILCCTFSCSIYLLSWSYRTLFTIHWFYLNLCCPFLAGFSLLCSLILTNYCVANIVHVHQYHSLVGIKYFWFEFLILIDNEKMVIIGRLIVKKLLNDLVRLQHNSCFTNPASS